MKILFDYQAFIQRYGGVPKYFVEMLKYFPKESFVLSVPFSDNQFLMESGLASPWHIAFDRGFKGKYRLYSQLGQIYSSYKICQGRYDIYHPTLYRIYGTKFLPKGKRLVVTIHDLNYSKIPNLYPNPIEYLPQKEIAIRADHIIAISQNTKKDLIEQWNIPENKITTIYHGISDKLMNLSENRLHSRRYILYVGYRAPYKNWRNCLIAYSRIAQKYSDVDLICTGSLFNKNEAVQIAKLGLNNRVIAVKASEVEMAMLYRDAELFVYPSFYEGFGMPILEAMVYGCPVVLSNTSCFPEIAGDAGAYFNPYKVEDIQYSMMKVLDDLHYRRELVKKGVDRIKMFSWKKCAEQHWALYKSLL